MNDCQKTAREDGFTLVEVLISMLIFSLISVGALVALSATLEARDRSQARLVEIEALATARRVMADDFAAMVRRQNRDGLGGLVDNSFQTIRQDAFELTRRARANPDGRFPRGDLLRVSWRVDNGRLVRGFLPHENPAQIADPIDRVILDGVDAMDLEPVFSDGTRNASLRGQFGGSLSADALLLIEGGISITLTHSNGTTTRHVFELPGA